MALDVADQRPPDELEGVGLGRVVLEPDEERGGEDLAGAVEVVAGPMKISNFLSTASDSCSTRWRLRNTSSMESMNRKPKRRWQKSSCMNGVVSGSCVITSV